MEKIISQNKSIQGYQFGILYGVLGSMMLVGARLVLWLNPPLPKCIFKELTGYPCPTCGATRCVCEFSQGHFWDSFLMNPLIFLIGVAIGLFAVYSIGVYFFNFPEIKFDWVKKKSNLFKILSVLAILVNWAYLITVHR